MKLAIRAIILYFPIVFIYKLFGNPFDNYWINTYWFLVSIDSIFVFIGLRKMLSMLHGLVQKDTIKLYRFILFLAACYWGVMAVIRGYLFFNIKLHSVIINSAGKITTGAVSIVLMFVLLSTHITAKKWFKR